MRLSHRDLKGIPVFTRSGIRVGTLDGVIIETSSLSVADYVVRRRSGLPSLMPKELLVHPTQVVSLDAERMIVEDASVAIAAEDGVAVRAPSPSIPGMTPRSSAE